MDDQTDMAVKDIHFSANILDPYHKRKSLTNDQQIAGAEFIHNVVASNIYKEEDVEVVLKEVAKDYVA